MKAHVSTIEVDRNSGCRLYHIHFLEDIWLSDCSDYLACVTVEADEVYNVFRENKIGVGLSSQIMEKVWDLGREDVEDYNIFMELDDENHILREPGGDGDILAVLMEGVRDGVVTCPKCGNLIEPDCPACNCGWKNPAMAAGMI